MALVSVVMAAFNEPAGVISQAIGSVLNQTHREIELLVLDDSTAPETVETIDRLAAEDARVHVVRRAERMGFVQALNIGLGMARGEYIARMDGDDISLPERVERQLAFFAEHPAIDVVGGAMDIIDGNGAATSHRNYPSGGGLRLFSLFRTPLAHPTVMMRRRVADDGFRYNEEFKRAEDLELWLRLMRRGRRIDNIPQTLLQYRVVGDLAAKRNRAQFLAAARARRINFSWRHPLWSCASVVISHLYAIVPRSVVSAMYKRENSRSI